MTKRTMLQSLEKNFETLEKIISELETGHLPLDKALKQFEKGIQISQNCQTALGEAEQKIKILSNDAKLEPFNEV